MQDLRNKRIVLTGNTTAARLSTMINIAHAVGAKISHTVSTNHCDLVVAAVGAGSKAAQAERLGIPVIDEGDFMIAVGHTLNLISGKPAEPKINFVAKIIMPDQEEARAFRDAAMKANTDGAMAKVRQQRGDAVVARPGDKLTWHRVDGSEQKWSAQSIYGDYIYHGKRFAPSVFRLYYERKCILEANNNMFSARAEAQAHFDRLCKERGHGERVSPAEMTAMMRGDAIGGGLLGPTTGNIQVDNTPDLSAIRDDFAKAAMREIIRRGPCNSEETALKAYKMADAMMKERVR